MPQTRKKVASRDGLQKADVPAGRADKSGHVARGGPTRRGATLLAGRQATRRAAARTIPLSPSELRGVRLALAAAVVRPLRLRRPLSGAPMEPRASAEPVRASSRLFSAQRLLRIAPRCSSECARVRARVQAAPLALRLTRARVSPARPGAAAGGCVAGCRRGREASRRARTRCLSALRRALCSRLALCKLCHAFPALPDASPGAQASRQHGCQRSAARHQAATQSASTTACGSPCRAATTRRPPRRGRARPACRAWMTWRWTSGCCGAGPSPPLPDSASARYR